MRGGGSGATHIGRRFDRRHGFRDERPHTAAPVGAACGLWLDVGKDSQVDRRGPRICSSLG